MAKITKIVSMNEISILHSYLRFVSSPTSQPTGTIFFGWQFVESEQLDGEFILILVVFQEMVEFDTQSMVEARQHGRAPNKDYVFCQIPPHINWRLKNSHILIKTMYFFLIIDQF